MTPERWERIGNLYEQALSRPPDRRAELLDQACAGDPALRREVESLLDAYEDDPDFLETPALPFFEHTPPLPEETDPEAAYVGPYRLVRPLGTGGMGEVVLAVRDLESTRQTVAIKLLRANLVHDDLLRRFTAEQQILGQLNHPHIARLLDAGRTEDGRPYLVMEYVDGLPLTAYCDRHRLTIEQRLRLFVQVCVAVQFAHRHLIVHRDLKPGNILVAPPPSGSPAEGRVKLLDFGIAKMLQPLTPDAAPVRTHTRHRLLTPAYASPEQMEGHPVATTSDVYSLGVLLYELLAGRRPYALEDKPESEVLRIVTAETPPRPSTVVALSPDPAETTPAEPAGTAEVAAARQLSPGRLQKRLRGDLDTIVLTALRKEPERRYVSAEALADDVQRYLDGLPVLARPDTVGYRLRKFVRRNRWGVAAAALVLASLLLGIGGTTWQARVATQERDRARLEARKAEQVTDLLVDLFQGSDPTQANDGSTTAREILDQGGERVRSELGDQPEVQAQMLTLIGRVYQNLGLYEQALPTLEEAVDVYRGLEEDPPELASALLQLANLHYRLGQFAEAEPPVREALDLSAAHYGPDHPEVASVLNTLALVLEELDQLDEARRVLRRVVEIRRTEPEAGANLAANLNNLAQMLQDAGELDEAEAMFREAVDVVRDVWGEEHPYMAFVLNSYAGLHEARGAFARAEADLDRALEIGTAVFSEEHPFIAVVHHNRGQLLDRRGEREAASEAYAQALDLRRRTLPPDHTDLAASLHGLAGTWIETGRAGEAEPLLREALAIRRQALAEGDWRIASTESLLGRCLLRLERLDEAEPLLLQSRSVLLAERGASDHRTQETNRALAELYDARGRPEDAARYRNE